MTANAIYALNKSLKKTNSLFVKLAKNIFEATENKPTILMLIDRTELEDKLITDLISIDLKYAKVSKSIADISKLIKNDFRGIIVSTIQKFEKTAEALFFTVKFVSEIISVKKDKDNKIVEGDPNKIKTVIDQWKFTRKISSLNPNWYLADIKNP